MRAGLFFLTLLQQKHVFAQGMDLFFFLFFFFFFLVPALYIISNCMDL